MQEPLKQMEPCWFSKWTLCNCQKNVTKNHPQNRPETIPKIIPNIAPTIAPKLPKQMQIFSFKNFVYNYKYKRQCMLECRKYGVVSKMKTTSLLPICIKSNGM